jgi:hypothetical protein
MILCRIRPMREAPIDGSYLYRKRRSLSADSDVPAAIPAVPLIGWEHIDPAHPSAEHIDNIPKVTHGLLYSYLADCVGKSGRGEAFRSLHCSSRSLSKLEVNYRHPQFCHVCCEIFASMKKKIYAGT